jgi:hypothetical protein
MFAVDVVDVFARRHLVLTRQWGVSIFTFVVVIGAERATIVVIMKVRFAAYSHRPS